MRCAVYIRVSTDRDEQKTSLENQQSLFYKFIEEKGWEVHSFYQDVDSGTTDKRQNLQRLIEDAKQRKFDVILAKELSRLARNGKLSYEIRDIAERNKIHIITLDNAVNTLEGNGNMFGLYAWMYEQESQRTSERIKASFRTQAQRGIFKGSIPPYGYTVVDGRLEIKDDDTPDVVRRIYRLYLEGTGFDAIARTLTRDGYSTPAQVAGKADAGIYWHGSTIKLILTNPHYTGDLVLCRETTRSVTSKVREEVPKDAQVIVPNTHLPIISREDFEAVQKHMLSRQQKRPKCKKHLFTNVAYCTDCGKSLWYLKNRKGYVCGTHLKHGKNACSQHSIKEEVLKSIILDDIRKLAQSLDEQDVFGRLEAKVTSVRKYTIKQMEAVDKQIQKLRNEKNGYIRLLAQQSITEEEYREVATGVNNKIEQLQEKKLGLSTAIEMNEVTDVVSRAKDEIQRFIAMKELTPEMLHRLVEKIEVTADGVPQIYYRFANPSAFPLSQIKLKHSIFNYLHKRRGGKKVAK
ncbi:MAG TPA: recombinase family protein [Brevibacillus sp.]|nr:recombinase family protein [Brevibacillus sp.]